MSSQGERFETREPHIGNPSPILLITTEKQKLIYATLLHKINPNSLRSLEYLLYLISLLRHRMTLVISYRT
jgi:hypothetical protein